VQATKTGRFQLWVSGINRMEAFTGFRIKARAKVQGYIDLDSLLLTGLSDNVFQGDDRSLVLFKWDDTVGNIVGMDLTRNVFSGEDSRKQKLYNYTFTIPSDGEYFWAAYPNNNAIPIALAPREFGITGDNIARTYSFWETQQVMSKAQFNIQSRDKNYKVKLSVLKSPASLDVGNNTKLTFVNNAAWEFALNQVPGDDIVMNLQYKYDTTDLQYVPSSRMTWAWYNGTNWTPIPTQVYNGLAIVKEWNVKLPVDGAMNVSPQTVQLGIMAKPLNVPLTKGGNSWGDGTSSAAKLVVSLFAFLLL
jgi:hypothetical protein